MSQDLQAVLDAVLDGILVVDASACVRLSNAEASRILEASPQKLEAAPIQTLCGPEHILATLSRNVMATRRASVADDVTIERRFDGDLVVDLAISPLPDDDDGGAVIVLRDRTMRNALARTQAQHDELSFYGQIAAGIAHEVMNPLGGIRGAAELIRTWSRDGRPTEAANVIVREVDRISSMIEELMVFARGDLLSENDVNLHRVIDDVIELMQLDPLSKGIEIKRLYDPSIPELRADANRLTQVILNLTRNALQAMSENGGALTFTTAMSLGSRIFDEKGRPVATVLTTVSDTGPGIPAEVLGRLATPFFSTRPGGTGLGLSIARHWIDRHGGTLRITSQLGQGTSVYVSLPLRPFSRDAAANSGPEDTRDTETG